MLAVLSVQFDVVVELSGDIFYLTKIRMIDNFDLIPFDFVEGEFYFIEILLRGKDLGIKINGNNHCRLIKTYSVYTKEKLDKIKPEIITMCETFRARAYVYPNRRNKKKIALELLSHLANTIATDTLAGLSTQYTTVCGRNKGAEKIWVVDIDTKDEGHINKIIETIEETKPNKKIIQRIPTKNGRHLLTHPFDSRVFQSLGVDVHKNNPTVLYIPNSINNEDRTMSIYKD